MTNPTAVVPFSMDVYFIVSCFRQRNSGNLILMVTLMASQISTQNACEPCSSTKIAARYDKIHTKQLYVLNNVYYIYSYISSRLAIL